MLVESSSTTHLTRDSYKAMEGSVKKKPAKYVIFRANSADIFLLYLCIFKPLITFSFYIFNVSNPAKAVSGKD